MRTPQDVVIRKAFLRLMPILLFSYFLAYIDRINVSFASITMNVDLGLNAHIYGLGAGVFFWGYFFCGIPSNLIMERIGTRKWISSIMITWGAGSACMILVQGPMSFITCRFLLGVTEAGFFPGVIVYLTYWFPKIYRGRIMGIFSLSLPLSLALGGPVSTTLLRLNGFAGFRGWQWIFIIEGAVTILFGSYFWMVMPDRAKDAKWLNAEERNWLQETIDSEEKALKETYGISTLRAFVDMRVVILAVIYVADTAANMGLAFFLPQILKSFDLSNTAIGAITAVPYIFGTLGLLAFGYLSDRWNSHWRMLLFALAFTGTGLIVSGLTSNLLLTVTAMSIAAVGIFGAKAPFWALPSTFLCGTAAAGSVALINSVGNLGGFVGPYVVGWVREATNSFEAGLISLGALALVAASLLVIFAAKIQVPPSDKTSITPSEAETRGY